MSDAALAAGFDLRALPPDFYADPFPTYRALRDHAPVRWMPDGTLLISRWADLDRVYRDTKTFSSDKTVEFAPKFGPTPLYEHHTTSLIFNDPPLHTRVRRLITGALTPRAIASMEPALVALVDRLLDAMARKGEVDLIEIAVQGLDTPVRARIRGAPLAVPGADVGVDIDPDEVLVFAAPAT